MKKTLIALILILVGHVITAQNYKFGKVSKEELQEKFYPLDSSANAAILHKKRRTFYSYTSEKGWMLNTIIQERIKIYNTNGYGWATKKIKLYTDIEEEKVSVKAYTYNLSNNKIEKTKLSKNEIFRENINKYWNSNKFTMPNLKEGSVVEWEYTIRSPFYWRIDDMEFQYKIPVKNVDTQIVVPEYFVFKNQTQGYFPINIQTDEKQSSITLNSKSRESSGYTAKTSFNQDKISFKSKITQCVLNEVPALIEESYVNNIDNYRSLLKFELTSTKFPNSMPKFYNNTWDDVTKTIYNNSNFGGQLKKSSYFKDDLATLVNPTALISENINKIFEFLKGKVKWDGYYNKYTSRGVKEAYKEGVGNTAEINLTLVAMLREAGINANPVILSTRNNGIPLFPTSDGLNYVIAAVEAENEIILLDATEEYSIPDVLPLRVLNWQGRLVRESGSSTWVDLIPHEPASKNSTMQVVIDSEGAIEGMDRVEYTNLNALNFRNQYLKLKEEDLILKVEEENGGVEISEFKIINKNELYKPVVEMYKFYSEDMVDVVGDKIYFKPLLFYTTTENPFKLEKREYPIDFGTPISYKNRVNITIPIGYVIESVPENLAIALPNNYGVYQFNISVSGNNIGIYSQLNINTAVYPTQNYPEIKEFYKLMVNKNLEQVVLKKE